MALRPVAFCLAITFAATGCGSVATDDRSAQSAVAPHAQKTSPAAAVDEGGGSGNPEADVRSVLDGYYDALFGADVRACDFLNSDGLRDAVTFGGLTKGTQTSCEDLVQFFGALGNEVADKSRDTDVEIGSRSATATVRFAKPLASQVVTLVREGDRWKIAKQVDLAEGSPR